ncbi:unnamed protein product [Peniophora sp. CBMAI 1063]|nr:unnamed protein product [Peniophora sp. CBMAI 1063]
MAAVTFGALFNTDSLDLQRAAVLALVSGLQRYMPAGGSTLVDGVIRPSLGWVVLSQLDRVSRAWIVDEPDLWRNIFTFGSWDAVACFAHRADFAGGAVDMDNLLRNATSDDLQVIGRPPASNSCILQILKRCGTVYSGISSIAFRHNAAAFIIKALRVDVFSQLHTLRLYVSSTTPLLHFDLPSLRTLEFYGVRDAPDKPIVAWRAAPCVSASVLAHIAAGASLELLGLEGVDVCADAQEEPVLVRVPEVFLLIKKPSSVAAVLTFLSDGIPDTTYCVFCRPSFTDPLPDWVWRCASINPNERLAVMFEGSRTMAWITIMPLEDWANARAPYLSEGVVPDRIYPPKQNQPTLIVRGRRISRLYRPDNGVQYSDAFTLDIKSYAGRVRACTVRELRISVDSRDVWLRTSKFCDELFLLLDGMENVVIEDERVAGSLAFVPHSCKQADIICREEWYGASGLLHLRVAVHLRRLNHVCLRGVERECDRRVVEEWRRKGLAVADQRVRGQPFFQRTQAEAELEEAKNILRYFEVRFKSHVMIVFFISLVSQLKDIAIREEMSMTY